MKKIIYLATILVFGIITLESFHTLKLMKKDGAAPGYTGSPGDTMKNCTACHGGKAISVNGWISSNIPPDGYIPNQTYTIKTVNKEMGDLSFRPTRFGFEISPQNALGDLMGKIVLTDTFRTKFVGGEKYITYTKNGIEGIDSLTWTFDWVAPPAGTGEVVFYGAYNSNYNGDKGGDNTFLSTLKVKERANSISDLSSPVLKFDAFPNPAKDIVTFNISGLQTGHYNLSIIDITGKTVLNKTLTVNSNKISEQLNILNWLSGEYFVLIEQGNSRMVGKFIKQ